MPERIAGVVNTLNEATNIRHCLGTLQWCDDLVVVDQQSVDDTPKVAAQMGARVFGHERTPGGVDGPAREFAVAQADADWVLVIDADEMVRPELEAYLRAEIATHPDTDVFMLPRANVIFGRQMLHGRNWPSRHVRFFRPGRVQLVDRIHHGIVPAADAKVRKVPARPELAIWHFSYPTISALVERIERYTTIEARQSLERRPRKVTTRFLVQKPAAWFVRTYIRGGGYRDGTAGLILAVSRTYYRFTLAAKMWEHARLEQRARTVTAMKDTILASHGKVAEADAP